MIKKYIKKVLPVEAVQWNGDNVEEIRSLYTRRYRGSRKATGFRAPNNMIQKGTNLIVYGRANTIINIIRLSDYVVVENGFFKIVSKNHFETEYEQQDNSVLSTKTEGHSQKPSSFSLRDLVLQIAPKHTKYYIKRLEEYGFKLKYINEAEIKEESAYIPFTGLVDKNGHEVVIVDRHDCIDTQTGFELWTRNKDEHQFDVKSFEAENNNWHEAFNKLVASFPDEIMKNTNHHANLSS